MDAYEYLFDQLKWKFNFLTQHLITTEDSSIGFIHIIIAGNKILSYKELFEQLHNNTLYNDIPWFKPIIGVLNLFPDTLESISHVDLLLVLNGMNKDGD